MYPFVRLVKEAVIHRNAAPLPLTGVHVSHHVCWPWDLDFWMELNNGRTLTLFDLGRIPLARRIGLVGAMRRNRWGLTIAGVTVRYRRRVRMFRKVEMRSRALCWDDKFIYLEQAMFDSAGHCTSHALYRSPATDRDGIVAPARVLDALGQDRRSPPMPGWVADWVSAEAQRPWPPMNDTLA